LEWSVVAKGVLPGRPGPGDVIRVDDAQPTPTRCLFGCQADEVIAPTIEVLGRAPSVGHPHDMGNPLGDEIPRWCHVRVTLAHPISLTRRDVTKRKIASRS